MYQKETCQSKLSQQCLLYCIQVYRETVKTNVLYSQTCQLQMRALDMLLVLNRPKKPIAYITQRTFAGEVYSRTVYPTRWGNLVFRLRV
jgi:hypothetical protein